MTTSWWTEASSGLASARRERLASIGAAQEGAMHAGLAAQVGDADEFTTPPPHGLRDGREFLAIHAPHVGSARGIGFGGGRAGRHRRAAAISRPAGDRETTPSSFSNSPSRGVFGAPADARSRRRIAGNHQRRGQAGASVGQTRGEIGGGRIFRGARRCAGTTTLPCDEVRDAVAIGVDEHPAGGEGIREMVDRRRGGRLIGKAAGKKEKATAAGEARDMRPIV